MWKCPRCETVNREGIYCEVCGLKRESRSINRDFGGDVKKEPERNNVLIGIVIALAVLLVGALCLLLGVVLGNNGEETKPTPSPSSLAIVSAEPERLTDDDDYYGTTDTDDVEEIPYLTPDDAKNTPTPSKKTTAPKTQGEVFYRVRKSPDDAKSQKGAFKVLENAIKEANKYKDQGYEVYDMNGNLVYTP